jgi:hypothetical protein
VLPRRLRKLIGTLLLTVFIPFYALAAMVIASAKLPGEPILYQTIAYAVLGLLWVLPAGLIVTWMVRPRQGEG